MFDDDVEGEARMLDGAGQHVSEEGVQDKRRGHDDSAQPVVRRVISRTSRTVAAAKNLAAGVTSSM